MEKISEAQDKNEIAASILFGSGLVLCVLKRVMGYC